MPVTSSHRSVLIVVVATASLLLAGLFLVVTPGDSSASQPADCPEGFTRSIDGTECLQDTAPPADAGQPDDSQPNDNVTTTTSCLQGVLSSDGLHCVVPRLDAAPAPAVAPADTQAAPIPSFTG